MNGAYILANDVTYPDKPKHTWSTNFKSYPGGVESFDVHHGPITSTYSQVWWTGDTNSIPPEIVPTPENIGVMHRPQNRGLH